MPIPGGFWWNDEKAAVPGGKDVPPEDLARTQKFFANMNVLVFFLGWTQAGQDFCFYKVLSIVEESG